MIVTEGGNPAYPGFSAAEPKMVPWVFCLTWHWVVLQNHISCLTSAQFHDVKCASHNLCLRAHHDLQVSQTTLSRYGRFGHLAKQSQQLVIPSLTKGLPPPAQSMPGFSVYMGLDARALAINGSDEFYLFMLGVLCTEQRWIRVA